MSGDHRASRTLLASCGGTFIVTFDGAAVQMVMPALRRDFHTGIYAVQWAMTAYLLVTTAAYLPTGRLGDDWGRSRVWHLGLIVFVAGSLACAVVPTLPLLIAARGLQALGAAAITANSAPLLLEVYAAGQRARALAIGSVAIGLGLLLGPASGALLTRAVSWRLLFVIAVPVAGVCWLVARGQLPRNRARRRHRRVDSWGAVLSAIGLGAVVVGGSSGRQWGWRTTPTLVAIVGGAALLVLFFVVERRRREPLLRLYLFRERGFVAGAGAAICAYAALFTMIATLPFFLIDVRHRSLIEAGLLVGVVPLALALAAPLAGWIADRIGARWVCTVGLAVVAGGMALALVPSARGGTGWIVVALVAVGAGLGAFEAPNSAASLGALAETDFGIGSATLGVVRNLGMTVGAALAGTLLGAAGGRRPYAAVELGAVHLALIFATAAAAVGAVAAALRPSGRTAAPTRRRGGG